MHSDQRESVMSERKVNDFKNVRIEDGMIYGLTLSFHFNVKISESENPSVCPKVNCDGMPVDVLCKKAWDAMKVSGRPSMKKLSAEELSENYDGKEVNWQVMVSQEAANSYLNTSNMSDSQLEREIQRLQAMRSSSDSEI